MMESNVNLWEIFHLRLDAVSIGLYYFKMIDHMREHRNLLG